MAAYGGLRHVSFPAQRRYHRHPMTLRPERMQELNAHLMLFYTGIKRTASDVAESYNLHDAERQQQLES